MTDFIRVFSLGLQHPAPESHLAALGTALSYAVAPQKPEAKSEEEDA
jgi:hypothetical protein